MPWNRVDGKYTVYFFLDHAASTFSCVMVPLSNPRQYVDHLYSFFSSSHVLWKYTPLCTITISSCVSYSQSPNSSVQGKLREEREKTPSVASIKISSGFCIH